LRYSLSATFIAEEKSVFAEKIVYAGKGIRIWQKFCRKRIM